MQLAADFASKMNIDICAVQELGLKVREFPYFQKTKRQEGVHIDAAIHNGHERCNGRSSVQ